MSEKFVVSARKFRPDSFESLLGQEAVSETLRRAILQQKTAHAYLFCGPRGVGKTSAARIFARAINCASPLASGEACGECDSCRAFAEQRSFNVFEMDAASNNSANDIRQLIEEVNIPPQVGRYKIYIIDEVHMLSTAAFNAFLKTLEEPPEYVVFIMATTEKQKILPTILSRCQVFDFKPIPSDVIIGQLRHIAQLEEIQVEEKALELIARKADGGMRDALSVFDRIASYTDGEVSYSRTLESLNILDDDYYFRFVDLLVHNDYASTLLLLDELIMRGFDPRTIVLGLTDFLRNLLLAFDPQTLPLLHLTKETEASYNQLAQASGRGFLYQAIAKLMECLKEYRNSNAKRLLVEMTLLSLTSLAQERVSASHTPNQRPTPAATPPSAPSPVAAPRPQPIAAPAPARPSAPPTPRQTGASTEAPQSIDLPKPPPTASMAAPRPVAPAPRPAVAPSPTATSAAAPKAPTQEKRSFTETEMQIAWNAYAEEHLQKNLFLKNAFNEVLPKLHNGTEIEAIMFNMLQVNAVERIKGSLLSYLRSALHNSDITLQVRQIETIEEERSQRSITPLELFRSLAAEPQTPLHQFIQALKLRPL
ncbi:DNA polymerase III subunit gamma/tau [Porphyromonas endodontalis]|uniref:DNA polymerase III subunit gamma/tau n=1 Tax=Porphyromonas endodontalis (strain ATCC 35406 / DSM 24491 / JCM 8526 / CCUG 16442 / BCRC 14492 / NCTC 13058 / HG 370) TaxID=553175 RepID=C3J7N6_POREA|nr:DNA polymerase III subunit gamma/tau [Porphyromonas endodontalis]EEN83760.1 DNA polymerase III, subunit gamma and tau [Porphyromonas endodontalis ATCC 35406]UBH65287.1 DNA polymerase III subunit gamma/tau [Porphyromonas endodontalis]SUB68094.1 DNA polymerase III subunit tau [Porphyromonas endodontalis]